MAAVAEQRFRLGPVTLGLVGEGPAVDAFVATLAPFATTAASEATVVFRRAVTGDGAHTVPLPRFHDGSLVADGLRAELSGSRLNVSDASGRGEVANAFRWLLAERLLERDSVMVHGVGLKGKRAAALFTGESGAGKSTLAAAAREGGLSLLGDELVIVEDGATAFAHGTPWNVGHPLSAPLVIFGTLGWAGSAAFTKIPPTELLRVAIGNVLLPRQDAATRARLATLLLSVIARVDTSRLDFAPNPAVAETIAAELHGR